MHTVCRCSLPVWRRSFFEEGDLLWTILARPGSAPGESGRKSTTLVRDHDYFIPTKFHQNLSSGSGEEVENVKVCRRTTTDGRTVRYDNKLTWAFGSGELKRDTEYFIIKYKLNFYFSLSYYFVFSDLFFVWWKTGCPPSVTRLQISKSIWKNLLILLSMHANIPRFTRILLEFLDDAKQ